MDQSNNFQEAKRGQSIFFQENYTGQRGGQTSCLYISLTTYLVFGESVRTLAYVISKGLKFSFKRDHLIAAMRTTITNGGRILPSLTSGQRHQNRPRNYRTVIESICEIRWLVTWDGDAASVNDPV
jgi:hypothetical protein